MISKSTEYAIRALVYVQLCNWEQKRPGVGEIAREIEAPAPYSAKILHTLTKHRLLSSMKGRGGGFFFENNQSDLTIFDVIHVMEGDAWYYKCGLGLKHCSDDNPCPLHEEYKVIRDGYHRLVTGETIASFAEKIRNGSAVLNEMKTK